MLDQFFHLKKNGVTIKTEILAGLTTFITMAYVLAVQPASIVGFGPETTVTDINGVIISKQAILITCALVSGIITILMALYTNLPFALSTGMGTNFMLGEIVQSGTFSFGWAMAVLLIAGLLFIFLSVLGVRDLVVRMIPKSLKISISAVIGFFIAYLGFQNTGFGVFDGGSITLGNFTEPAVVLAVVGFLLISILSAYRIPGGILIGIILTTIIGIPMGITQLPETFVMVPNFSEVKNIAFCFDFSEILTPASLVWIFIFLFTNFFSTLACLMGVGGKAKMLDQDGNFPNIQKPFLVDAIGTVVGSMFGCSTITSYVESSAGVEAGGRTGLTSLTTGIAFLCSLFFAPLFLIIPSAATGPAMIYVGFLMISSFAEIDFSDFTEAFGPFVMIMFGAFTGDIAAGISAGILAHVAIKLSTRRHREVHWVLYVLCIPLILYFVFR